MKQYKITFWHKSIPNEGPFILKEENFNTSALISEINEPECEIFHVKLLDIGLYSKYGEFAIIKTNGFWETYDKDGSEFNFLKANIIEALVLLNK